MRWFAYHLTKPFDPEHLVVVVGMLAGSHTDGAEEP